MTNETKKPRKKPGGWSAVRPQLSSWDKPALLALGTKGTLPFILISHPRAA